MMTIMSRAFLRRWSEQLTCLIAMVLYILPPVHNTSLLKAHRTVYACENSTLRLQCAPGEVIQLVRANFGRYSITICNEHGNTAWSVRCSSARAIFVLSDRCDQKQECAVLASEFVFGDPCPNTHKYLEAHYKCTPAISEISEQKTPPPWLTTSAPQRAATEPPFKPPPPSFAFTTKPTTTFSTTITSTTPQTTTKTTTKSTTTTVASGNTEIATTAKVPSSSIPTTTGVLHDTRSSSTERPTHQAARADFAPAVVVPRRPVIETHTHVDVHGQQEDVTDIRHIDSPFDQSRLIFPPSGSGQDYSTIGGHLNEQERTAFQRSHCPPIESRHIFWNWTEAGQTAVEKCPRGSSGAALWRCRLDNTATPQWFQHPDLSECRSPWLGRLELQLKHHSSVLKVATDLSRATDSTSMYGGDLNMAVRLVNLLPAQLNGNSHQLPEDDDQREAVVAELTKTVVSSTSNLLSERQRPMWKDFERPERMAVVTSLLLGMEENAFLLASSLAKAKSVMQSGENLVMSVRLLRTDWTSGPAEFPSADERQVLANFHDSISIPYAALQANAHDSQVRLVFMFYDGMDAILTPESRLIENVEDVPRQIVNSRVVSASLGKGRHVPLPAPATITLHHLHTENVSNPRCVFWDYTVNQWSQQGCRLASTNMTHTQCLCDHLTNFAVLMDVHAVPLSSSDAWALELITYTGCSISIVCLVLALITFQLLKGLKSDRTSIHKNLCLCLLIGEVVFLAGINQTQEPIVCGIVAGLLHYFFLCAFAWMFFEGFQLYVMLIEVFEVERSRIRWYYALAYGVPGIIVAVSCIVDPHNYGTTQYCWLRSDNYFIFAFVGPVVAIILANLIFLGMAVSMMCRHSVATVTMKAKEQSRLSSFSRDDECILMMKFRAHLAWIRGAVALVFLLGLTWALGLLYVSQRTVPIAYAFTIFNSLQGLFIFFFHCVQNEKMRTEYRRLLRQLFTFCDCLGATKAAGVSGSSAVFNNSGGSASGKSQQHQSSFLTASTSASHCHSGSSTAAAAAAVGGSAVAGSVSSSASFLANMWSQQNGARPVKMALDATMANHAVRNSLRHNSNRERAHERKTGSLRSIYRTHNVACVPSAGNLLNYNMVASSTPLSAPQPSLHTPTDISAVPLHTMNDTLVRHPEFFVVYSQQQQQNNQPQNLMLQGQHSPYIDLPEPVYEEIDRDIQQQQQQQQQQYHQQQQQQLQQLQQLAGVQLMADDETLRQSDISRQSSRSYGDSRPLIAYETTAATAQQQQQQQLSPAAVQHLQLLLLRQQQQLSPPVPSTLCESNLRHFERNQVLADIQRLQYSGAHMLPSATSPSTDSGGLIAPLTSSTLHIPHPA